jgi:cobalt transporter subunit CbtA
MDMFRRLMTIALIAGTAAGLLLAALQHVIVGPLIYRAEQFEQAADHAEHAGHGGHAAAAGAPTAAAASAASAPSASAPESAVRESVAPEWQPADGMERTMYTALGTGLTGIGFAALLFGVASALGLELTVTRGVWLGLIGFACCTLAPAIGLPPKPPGAAAADLHTSQLWWVGTAVATALGLLAIVRAHGWWTWRIGGMLIIALPHLIGAPEPVGASAVPPELSRQFAIASVATQAVFWILLGGIGGGLYARTCSPAATERAR